MESMLTTDVLAYSVQTQNYTNDNWFKFSTLNL